jgi:glyoxylate reductase
MTDELRGTVRPRVFVCRPIAREALDLIANSAEMEVWPDELPPPAAVIKEKAREADGLLSLLTDRIDAAIMGGAPRLRVISNMAVGYDNVDVAEATRRRIVVGITPGVLTETSADFAFALLMAAARRVVEADRYTKQGRWKTWGPQVLLGRDIHHATLGIIGLGRIGRQVARRAHGFDMRVIYHTRVRRSAEEERELGVEYVSGLAELLAKSDFVSVHVPATAETFHLIGARELAMMKPSAVLVNTSRGTVVDQHALYEALREGKIFGAGLDVTETEPIPLDDPLLALENVIVAPHIGSASVPTRRKMALMAAENLVAGLRGEAPPHCVNPEAIYGKG